MRHDRSAAIGTEGWTKREADTDHAIGRAQALSRQMFRQQLGAAWESRAFTEAQNQAQDDERRKSTCDTRQGGRNRPDGKPERERAVGVDPLGEPARQNLSGHVGPEECAEKQADLRV
jgi:hypothetical protein